MSKEEELAIEIMDSHYKIITRDLVGVQPIQIAKEQGCIEFKKARQCALLQVNQILGLPIGKVKALKKWNDIKNKLETL
ncbi:MAG: hypothetical protein ACK5B9_15660 [Flavobacteriia bacterium]|jgi:hypothetical protein